MTVRLRAFLGTFLSASNQKYYGRLTDRLIGRHPEALRRIPEASAHLTYAFIAALDEARQEAVLSAVSTAAARHPAIAIRLGPPRVLAAGPTPRLICADITLGADTIRGLADDLAAALRGALPGADVRSMKSAHVTLARFRHHASRSDAKAVAATLADAAFAEAVADDRIGRVQLIASHLTASGAVYTIVSERALG